MQCSEHYLKWQNLFHYFKIHKFGPIFVTNVFLLWFGMGGEERLFCFSLRWLKKIVGSCHRFFVLDIHLCILGQENSENSDENQTVFLKILCSFILSLLIIAMHISYIVSHFGSDHFFRMVLVYLWEMRNCFQISHVISIELWSKIATVAPIRCRSKSLKRFSREIELLLVDVAPGWR